MVANFWRATQRDPEAVARWADNPISEVDLHATHRWLVLSEDATRFRQRMRDDPDYCDAKVAGRWCWGLCCWIGNGWCPAPVEEGSDIHCRQQRPRLGDTAATGVHRSPPQLQQQLPHLGDDHGSGVHRSLPPLKQQRPHLGGTSSSGENGVHRSLPKSKVRIAAHNPGSNGKGVCAQGKLHQKRPRAAREAGCQTAGSYHGVLANHGTCAERRAWLIDWFGRLRDRLRNVRVCCGDWLRVCDSPSVTTRLGITGIFFDPPYSAAANRDKRLYAHDSDTVAVAVRRYCLERGNDPLMRLCLAGYAGEGHEELEQHGWDVVEWQSQGGYANRKGNANRKRERLWFSPHCLRERTLFDEGT